MYVEPNTNIRLLSYVPLDSSYDHTIYFSTKSAQTEYFMSCTKYSFTNQSYQRVQRGWMRVQGWAENFYDCNYLMFQNSAWGNKWFYAFITSVEYINNEVAQIGFEIDVMQTWFFDYNLDQCWVEREHTASDNYFENTVVEDVNLGNEYVCSGTHIYDLNDMSVCILANRVSEEGTEASRTINNIYTPMNIVAGVPATDPEAIDTLLEQYNENDIVTVYQYPSFLGDASTETAESDDYTTGPNLSTIDGYTPKNKKLFSYPYNWLLVTNNSGQTAELKWELWDDSHRGEFRVTGVFVSTPAVICYPLYYRGIYQDYDSGIVMSNFPQCPWAGDTFKAWWAQNKASFVTSGITSVLSSIGNGVVAGALTGGNLAVAGISAVTSIGSTVASSVAKVEDIKNTPSQTHGQTQTDSLNPGIGRVQFNFYNMCIRAQEARIIDDYFTRYGYAIKRNKVPNRNVRPHWTYTKTAGCTITGSVPADDAKKICDIYNNGITFWANGGEVGNYSLDNSI